jgi:transcriptional regulator with XRE-family HTH domain
MTFGICLKFLLTTLNIRMSQLAKAINVDSSLVNRWVHEKRIPSSIYLDNIAEFLAKIPAGPIQLKLVEELTIRLDNSTATVPSKHNEKISWILHHSLNNSLILQNRKYNTKKTGIIKPVFSNAINLSEKDKLIYGIENIYHAFLSLLDLAIHEKSSKSKNIYLTYHNNTNDFFFNEEMLNKLNQKLLEVITNNWQITYLLRLDSSIDSIIKFIHFVLPLIKTGKLKLFYLTNSELFMTRKDLYIVSGIGALSCFPSDFYSGTKCAFFLTNPSAIDVFTNYADLLVENNANDIIKYYKPDMNGLYFSSLTEANEKRGNQYSYNNSFSKLLIPLDLYLKFINQTDLSNQEKELSLYYYKKQFNGFFKNLHNHKFMDIYFISLLDKLCEDKILYLYTYSGIKIISMETQDIIDYLGHVKDIINTYSNYHIAIVYNDIDDFVKNITLFIKERQMVFLDVFDNKRESIVRLSINDPVIVNAFVTYYNSLWERISPLNKDNQEIILLIEDYIKVLKNELL